MTVTAKPMEVSGILMVAARIVQNGRILISGPPGPDSWRSYRRDGTLKRNDHHLDAVFLDFLLPEFQRLSEYSLLFRCFPGYSQKKRMKASTALFGTVLLNTGTKGLMLWKLL